MKTYLIKLVIILNLCLIGSSVKAEVKEYHYIWVKNKNIFNQSCKQCNSSKDIYYLGKLVVDEDNLDTSFVNVSGFSDTNIQNNLTRAVNHINNGIKDGEITSINEVYNSFNSYVYIEYNIHNIPDTIGKSYFEKDINLLNLKDIEPYISDKTCRPCIVKICVKPANKPTKVVIILPKS